MRSDVLRDDLGGKMIENAGDGFMLAVSRVSSPDYRDKADFRSPDES